MLVRETGIMCGSIFLNGEIPWVGQEKACEMPWSGNRFFFDQNRSAAKIPWSGKKLTVNSHGSGKAYRVKSPPGMSNQKIEPHISWDFLKYSAHHLQKFEYIRQTGKPLPNPLFDNRGIANAVSTKQNESYVKC